MDLSTWNIHGDDALTQINRPDSLSAIPHSLPAMDPEQADLRLLVTQLVAELHSRGGLDAGHAAWLDHWIDGQLPGWLEVVKQQADARRRVVEQLIAVDRQNLQREGVELGQLREQQLILEQDHAYWRDVLAGHNATPPLAPTQDQVVAAPVLPELPDYRPRTYRDQPAAPRPVQEGDGLGDATDLPGQGEPSPGTAA